MSVNFSIICKECKKRLWIGQSPKNLYSGEPEVMDALKDFLFNHIGHKLTFDAPELYDDMLTGDWEEIEVKQ